MRAARALAVVLFAAGCGLDIVGTAAVEDVSPTADAAAPTVDASRSDVEDASLDANDGSDGNGCATCLDAGPNIACIANACTPVRRVFVTNAGFAANLGGQSGADAKCQAAASAQHLGGTWLAWITVDGSNAPQDRFSRPDAGYVLLDKAQTLIAASSEELLPTNGGPTNLAHAIDVDETGAVVTGETEVWTGTTIYGFGSGSTCNNWSTNDGGIDGTVGHLDATGIDFTEVYLQTCDRNAQHLYCFEQ